MWQATNLGTRLIENGLHKIAEIGVHEGCWFGKVFYMNTAAMTIIGFVFVALVYFLRLRASINKSVNAVKKPPSAVPEGTVQCFSCGMVVPVEKALEKKGRYFCGVKRNDRNGNPVHAAASKKNLTDSAATAKSDASSGVTLSEFFGGDGGNRQ